MFASRPIKAVAGVAVAAFLLTSCSAADTTTASVTKPTSALSGTDSKACAVIADQHVDASTPIAPVIVDRTGSGRALELSPDLAPVLARIQSTGTAIQTIGVNGSGVDPHLGTPIALDPAPGNSSRNADLKRTAALGCVQEWLHNPSTLPAGDNTDLLAALSTATRQNPAEMVVISDGINSTAELDLSQPLTDPVAAAERIRSSGSWTAQKGVVVHWFNLAETTPPLTEARRREVSDFWGTLLGQNLHLQTRTGTTTAGN